MRNLLNLSFLVFVALAFSVFAQNRELVQENPSAEQRFALVIGNAAYASGRLRNPVNDARDLSAHLASYLDSVRRAIS